LAASVSSVITSVRNNKTLLVLGPQSLRVAQVGLWTRFARPKALRYFYGVSMKKIVSTILALFICTAASAEDWITVNDMSQVNWQITPSGRVYFRNLNEFRSDALACCYNYYLDTTTDTGKALWSVVLTKMTTSSKLILGTPNISEAGPITYAGIW
jgi:hypothetical protein